MSAISRIFESSSYIQKYALDYAIKINNFIGTPTYDILFKVSEEDSRPCEKNIVIDLITLEGKSYLTCYIHVERNIYLLYNDNPRHWVSPQLNAKFSKIENVIDVFDKFTIIKNLEFDK
jgi:hypothetical protein